MSAIPIEIAVEDELSEAVVRRILAEAKRGFSIGSSYRGQGYGYLKKTLPGWNRAAKGKPMLVLTDLDRHECAAGLICAWLPEGRHPNLIFRVAVREVEAWILADRTGLSQFLRCLPSLLPEAPESLGDPKAALIAAARKAKNRMLRDDIVPTRGSTAQIGRGYNLALTTFVRDFWSVNEAANRAPSLARAVARLQSFQPSWSGT